MRVRRCYTALRRTFRLTQVVATVGALALMTQAVTVKLELTLTFGLKVASSQVEISATVKPQEVTTKNIKVSKGGKAVNFSQQLQFSNRGN